MGMGREGEGDTLRVVFAANFDVWRRRWSNWSHYARVMVKDVIEAPKTAYSTTLDSASS